jgi:hypothetical protein
LFERCVVTRTLDLQVGKPFHSPRSSAMLCNLVTNDLRLGSKVTRRITRCGYNADRVPAFACLDHALEAGARGRQRVTRERIRMCHTKILSVVMNVVKDFYGP